MSNSDQAAQCDNGDEADPGHNIVEGPPAAGCVEDGERVRPGRRKEGEGTWGWVGWG